jgi:predicted hydrocarbon binding protein
MPFRVKNFQENAERWVDGAARNELIRACEMYALLTTPQQKTRCIQGMMEVLDREVDEGTRQMIMETCGRHCIGTSILEKAVRLQQQSKDLDDLLERLNKAHIGGGHLHREGNVIHASYDRCYCGSVSKAREIFSDTYCHCSCGWYQKLFVTLLDQPVEVDLLGSILQGDERCEFRIQFPVPE